MSIKAFGQQILKQLPNHVKKSTIFKDELTLHVDLESLIPTIQFLKTNPKCQFTQLVDIAAIDYPGREKRFEVVYPLLSQAYSSRILVKTTCADLEPVPSLSGLFSSAIWYEREQFDMFGIVFEGNPDLRRILTDYGFEGHPLRKDFPLTGYTEVRWDEEEKRIVHEPVEMTQEFRKFQLDSPWQQVPK